MMTDAIYKRVDDLAQLIAQNRVDGEQVLVLFSDSVVLFKDEDTTLYYSSVERYMDVVCGNNKLEVVEGGCVYDVREMERMTFKQALGELNSLMD
ncbi:MAG: hypothetical protein U0M06_04175 [Clostridia bacterium]|nr:hypothetical protein [Clostridia bacterium]